MNGNLKYKVLTVLKYLGTLVWVLRAQGLIVSLTVNLEGVATFVVCSLLVQHLGAQVGSDR